MDIRTFFRNSRNQLDARILATGAVLIVALAISYAAPVAQNAAKAQNSRAVFPATVCPPRLGDGTTTVFLPKYRSSVRHIVKKSLSFYKSASSTENISSNALLVDSNISTSFALNSSGNGIGAVICESGIADQWFVGGSGGLTSKAQLDIVNSGLSPASVEITGYSSKAQLPVVSLSVPANSDRSVLVDALVPGEESVVLHVVTRSGRVTSFLFDERKKGLSFLGSDFVNPQSSPSRDLVIPALLQSPTGKVASTFRILVPGTLDANIKLTVNSGDGSFTPLGFDGRTIPHGKVLDIPLSNLTSATPMSIHVESDQPVVAGVLTEITRGDFAWSSPVSRFISYSGNFLGLSPKFVFTGPEIDINISWKNSAGKSMNQRLTGSDIAFWIPNTSGKSGTSGIRTVSFTNNAKNAATSSNPVYAGVIIPSASGGKLAYLPLKVGAALEKSTLPIVDVHSLSR